MKAAGPRRKTETSSARAPKTSRVAPEAPFDDRVVFVTGAASGIGQAIAALLSDLGARLSLLDIDPNGLETFTGDLERARRAVETTVADVADEVAVERAIDRTLRRYGRLDCAINAAGVLGPIGPLARIDEDAAARTFSVNCTGTWISMKHEARAMRANNRGSIVNVASVNGVRAASDAAIYSATKYAVVGMTKSAAVEYGAHGIRINALCPGAFPTPLLDASLGGRTNVMRLSQGIPMRRLGRLHEVAEAAAWLCSDLSSYVTGTAFIIDGGLLLR